MHIHFFELFELQYRLSYLHYYYQEELCQYSGSDALGYICEICFTALNADEAAPRNISLLHDS